MYSENKYISYLCYIYLNFRWENACKAYKAYKASRAKTLFLQVQALYKLCKALANRRVPKQSFGSQNYLQKQSFCTQTFGYQSKALDRKPKVLEAQDQFCFWIALSGACFCTNQQLCFAGI